MNYAELAERLYGKPHLATPSLLKTASYLLENQLIQVKPQNIEKRKDDVTIVNGVGYVDVKGTLVDEESWLDADCGITSYERLAGEFEYLIVQQGIKDIVMVVNSGGGEAYGAFEVSSYVRDLADQYGTKITAYVDKIAASGGYVWASVAHEIIANDMSEVGSIGVVVQLYNDSEHLKQNGIDRVFVYAGDEKIPFNPDGTFTEEFISNIQDGVNTTYDTFVKHVAKYRNLSTDQIKATQARVFSAKDSLQLGLIDRIESRPSFRNSLENQRGKQKPMSMFGKGVDVQTHETMINDLNAQKELLSTQLTKAQEDLNIEQQKVAGYLAEKEQLQSKIESLQAVVDQVEQEKAEKIKTDRIAKITAVVAEDKVDSIYESTKTLDESAFQVIVDSFGNKRIEKQEEFKELGFGAQVDEKTLAPSDFSQSLTQHILNNKKAKK